MTDKALSLAACELNQIFRYTNEEDVNRIPLGLRMYLKDIADSSYIPDINPEEPLEKLKLMPETEQLLAMIYYYYWSDESEFDRLTNEKKSEIQKLNDELFQGNSTDDLYAKEKEKREKDLEKHSLPIKKTPWYKRLFKWWK